VRLSRRIIIEILGLVREKIKGGLEFEKKLKKRQFANNS